MGKRSPCKPSVWRRIGIDKVDEWAEGQKVFGKFVVAMEIQSPLNALEAWMSHCWPALPPRFGTRMCFFDELEVFQKHTGGASRILVTGGLDVERAPALSTACAVNW